MGGVAEQRHRSLRPMPQRRPVVQCPFQPRFRQSDERARLRRPALCGKARNKVGAACRLAPAGRVPAIAGDDDNVDGRARLDRIMHEVSVAAEPQMDRAARGIPARPAAAGTRPRQAVRPAKRGGSRWPSRWRTADHSPSAPISAKPRSSSVCAPERAETVMPLGWATKSSTRMPSLSVTSSCRGDRVGERGLQIAAMDRPIRRAVALLRRSRPAAFARFRARLRREHAQSRGRDGRRPQPLFQVRDR